MKYIQILAILFFLSTKTLKIHAQTIIINEIMSYNEHTIADEDGDFSDWIELYNYGSQVVSLQGVSISDDVSDLNKWSFPNIDIQPNEYKIIFASSKNRIDINKELHTNFKIKQSGEAIYLSHQGQVISSTSAITIPEDKSYGTFPNGNSSTYSIFDIPTPLAANQENSQIIASHFSGFYQDSFHLSLTPTVSGQKIYYTLNGEIPTSNSLLYTSPILIQNNANTPNNWSDIPTTPLEIPDSLSDNLWHQPLNVNKSNILRYASFEGNNLKSPVYNKTYFVNSHQYNYPVVSIVTDSLNLFDDSIGIYIPGLRHEKDGFGWFGYGNYHNRGREWERPIHVSYFETDGNLAFETNAGMRMRGNGSATMPQKSFGIYFRNEYGLNKIAHPVFSNTELTGYKRLVFRNSGQDFRRTHFKDALIQSLLRPLALDLQNFEPSIVFINGEYWGIHNIREKYDKHYFKNHYGVEEEDSIDILKWCGFIEEEGNNDDYYALEDYIYANDLAEDVHYEYVKSQVDISNFIDFQIAEIYFANHDWPCNNYKMWKTNKENSKWRFLIYDLDFTVYLNGIKLYDKLGMKHATGNDGWNHCECSNILFIKLLENSSFKELFINRFKEHLSTIFRTDHVLNHIDTFTQLYNLEIEEHIDRWNYPLDMFNWFYNIEIIREFAINRPCFMKEDLIEFFNLTELDFDCSNPDDFKIEESSLLIIPNPTSNNFYFKSLVNDFALGDVIIRNINGQIILNQSNIIVENKDSGTRVDVSQFASGVYTVTFQNDNYIQTEKLIIIK